MLWATARKIRHRDKLVAATKSPVFAKRAGLKSDKCLSAKGQAGNRGAP